MNRFRKAWLALAGKLEPEVREVVRGFPVPSPSSVCDLYAGPGRFKDGKYDRDYFLTCEQAHNEVPKGEPVEKVPAYKVGTRYFLIHKEVKPRPKPKRAKGKRG